MPHGIDFFQLASNSTRLNTGGKQRTSLQPANYIYFLHYNSKLPLARWYLAFVRGRLNVRWQTANLLSLLCQTAKVHGTFLTSIYCKQ